MLELQVKLLGDIPRNEALYKALEKSIRPGKSVVVDIGSGTGLLSFFAEKLGARECYAYEADPGMFTLSKKLAAENKITKCKFFNMYSSEVKRPPQADIVISETLGNFALEENILETLQDARRFLKPGGIIIPHKLTQYIAPVTSRTAYDKINVWDSVGYGISMNAAKADALSHMYVHTFHRSDLLDQKDSVKIWDEIDFDMDQSSIRKAKIVWQVKQSTTIYGFAAWWNAELIPGIHLSTSSFDVPTHWEQIFLPLPNPLSVKAGQTVTAEIKSDSRLSVGIDVAWTAKIS